MTFILNIGVLTHVCQYQKTGNRYFKRGTFLVKRYLDP
nr:MAG TPA: protein of unknown function (DUF4157) [Caudoviricetes sp.]